MAQRYFVWIEQMSSNSNKSFVRIKKSLSNKLFSFIQSNPFFECIYAEPSLFIKLHYTVNHSINFTSGIAILEFCGKCDRVPSEISFG